MLTMNQKKDNSFSEIAMTYSSQFYSWHIKSRVPLKSYKALNGKIVIEN